MLDGALTTPHVDTSGSTLYEEGKRCSSSSAQL